MIDPFSHRKKLALPKLVMLGTNDNYWPVDAAKFYFYDLPGEKHLHYVPNAGHGLDLSIVETLTGYFRMIAGDEKRPRFDWHFESDGETARLAVRAETRPAEVRLFSARSERRDFRKAKWSGVKLEADRNGGFWGTADVPGKGKGFLALYGALTFKTSAGESVRLCTNAEVFPARLPGRKKK
jgi:PhoPQ-activated pathogenicity-related protein